MPISPNQIQDLDNKSKPNLSPKGLRPNTNLSQDLLHPYLKMHFLFTQSIKLWTVLNHLIQYFSMYMR